MAISVSRGGFQFGLVPWTLCGSSEPVNDHRTVSPVVTVTVGGDHVVSVPVTEIVAAGACAPATLAVNRPVNSAVATASTANAIRRMKLSPVFPCLPA